MKQIQIRLLFFSAVILISGLVFLSGCDKSISCDRPYVIIGSDCCLDQDSDGICDTHEGLLVTNDTAIVPDTIGPSDTASGSDIRFDIKSTQISRDFNDIYLPNAGFARGASFSRFNLSGTLVNNKDFDVGDLRLELRFINKNAQGTGIEYYGVNYGLLKVKLTNQYYAVDQKLLFQGLSVYKFPKKSSKDITVEFENVPGWDSDGDYSLGLSEAKGWKAEKYDIDEAELILFWKDQEVQTQTLSIGSMFERDTYLNISRIDGSYYPKNAFLDAMTVEVENFGSEDVIAPKIVVEVKRLDVVRSTEDLTYSVSENDYRDLEIILPNKISADSKRLFRFSLEDLGSLSKGDYNDFKGYKLYTSLYDGDVLLDRKINLISSGKEMVIDHQNPKLEMQVGPSTFGYKVSILQVYPTDSSRGQGVSVKLEKPRLYTSDMIIADAVLDVFCGTSIVFDTKERMYDGFSENIWVPFQYGECDDLVVNLRDGINPVVYAADSYRIGFVEEDHQE